MFLSQFEILAKYQAFFIIYIGKCLEIYNWQMSVLDYVFKA